MNLRIITSVAVAAGLALSLSACQKKADDAAATTTTTTATDFGGPRRRPRRRPTLRPTAPAAPAADAAAPRPRRDDPAGHRLDVVDHDHDRTEEVSFDPLGLD